MAEIVELIQISGSDLSSEAERAFLDESNGNERKPYQLEKAQREYQGFYDYFVRFLVFSFNWFCLGSCRCL